MSREEIQRQLREARGALAVTQAEMIVTVEDIKAGIERAEDKAWLRVYGTEDDGRASE